MENDMQTQDQNSLLPFGQTDHEGAMARADLYKIANYSVKLFKKIQDDTQLEAWVQAKIQKAADYVASVYHYIEYEMKFSEYGAKLENSDMYSESEKQILQNKLTEARETLRALKIAQAAKLVESKKPKKEKAAKEEKDDDRSKYDSDEDYYNEHPESMPDSYARPHERVAETYDDYEDEEHYYARRQKDEKAAPSEESPEETRERKKRESSVDESHDYDEPAKEVWTAKAASNSMKKDRVKSGRDPKPEKVVHSKEKIAKYKEHGVALSNDDDRSKYDSDEDYYNEHPESMPDSYARPHERVAETYGQGVYAEGYTGFDPKKFKDSMAASGLKVDMNGSMAKEREARAEVIKSGKGYRRTDDKGRSSIAPVKPGESDYDTDQAFAKKYGKTESVSTVKPKPSAGLSAATKSATVKKAGKGSDLGKPSKGFKAVADKAAKEYGSKEKGTKVAAAAMWKNVKRESQVSEAVKKAKKEYNKDGNVESSNANLLGPKTSAVKLPKYKNSVDVKESSKPVQIAESIELGRIKELLTRLNG